MDVVGAGATRLDPHYYAPSWFSDNSWQFPRLDGEHRLPVVDAGTASAEELTPETPYNHLWSPPPQAQVHLQAERRGFGPGERVQQSWFQAPLRPGLWPGNPVQRDGDLMTFRLAAFTDGAGNVAEGSTSWFEGGLSTSFRMYADGALIVESDAANGLLSVPSGSEEFRIEYDVSNAASWAQLSTQTRSVWTFTSATPEPGATRVEPLLTVAYDVELDLSNQLPPPRQGRPHTIELTVGHQLGAPVAPIRGNASLAVSYDSGQSWRTIPQLREVAEGRFVATLPPVAPTGNDGFVSLRFQAEDEAGKTVEQEVIRAYAVPPR